MSGATTALDAALQLARDLADTQEESVALERLGALAAAQADWPKALEFYKQAAAKLAPAETERHSALTRAQIHALLQTSFNARRQQAWENADQALTHALELEKTLSDRALHSELLQARGDVAAGQTRWNQAIAFYADALAARAADDPQRVEIETAQAAAYQALGDAEYDAQNWQDAETAYNQALALHPAPTAAATRATLFTALGDVTAQQARWDEAFEYYTHARAVNADPAQLSELDAKLERAHRARQRVQQADAQARGDAAYAADEWNVAHAEYLAALNLATDLQDRRAQADLFAKLGAVENAQTDFDAALTHYRAAASLYDASEHAANAAP